MRFLTRNLLWKLLALVAAFGVWLNVASEPELATIVSVPVEYNNFPKDLEISSDIVESIDVEARGPAGQLRSLNDSRHRGDHRFRQRQGARRAHVHADDRGIETPARDRSDPHDTRAAPIQVREASDARGAGGGRVFRQAAGGLFRRESRRRAAGIDDRRTGKPCARIEEAGFRSVRSDRASRGHASGRWQSTPPNPRCGF